MADRLQLTLKSGPSLDVAFRLEKEKILIGRGFQNDISIVNHDVSREHARLTLTPENVYQLEDVSSKNGTFVNEVRVEAPVSIKAGDVIRLGAEVKLLVESVEAFESTQTISRAHILQGISEADTKKTNVFISYSRKNIEFVQLLHKDLVQQNFRAWVDWEDIPLSADWWEEIVDAISAADAFIFVISPTSLQSEVCQKEVRTAVELNKNIVPILRLDPQPEDTIPPELTKPNWVYMRTSDEYRKNFREMADTLQTDLEWVKDHTRLLVRAIEWHESGKESSALLRGDDLTRAEQFLAESRLYQLKPTQQHIDFIRSSRVFETKRQRRTQLIGIGTLIVLAVLLVFAVGSAIDANQQENIASTAAAEAERNAQAAVRSQETAEANEEIARRARELAVAQRATAEAASTQAVKQEQIALNERATAVSALDTAEIEKRRAVEAATRARSSQLAAQAQQLLDINAPLATVLTIDALSANENNKEAVDLLASIPYYFPPVSMFFSGHQSPITAVDWSLSGKLASADENGVIYIWDLETHQPAVTLLEHSDAVTSLKWGPNDELASSSIDGTVIIWDLDAEKSDWTITEHTGPVYAVEWSLDEPLLATGGSDSSIMVWNLDRRELAVELYHAGEVRALAWNNRGDLASGSTDHSVIVWDLKSGNQRLLLGHTEDILSLAWGPRQQLASGSADSTIITWDIFAKRVIERLQQHTGAVLALDWSGDDRIASASEDSKVYVWDPLSGEFLHELKGHIGSVRAVAWGKDNHLFTGGDDQNIVHWETNYLPNLFAGHLDQVSSTAWSDDGTQFASGSDDNDVLVWDPNTAEILVRLTEHRDHVTGVDWSSEGILASSSQDGYVILWDIPKPRSKIILRDHRSPVLSIAWSEENDLASGDDAGNVIVWNWEFALVEHTLTGHDGAVNSVAWDPQGRLTSAGSDQTIIIWDLLRRQPSRRFSGHTDAILQIAWSLQGVLASASADGTIIIWDSVNGTPLQTLRGHRGAVHSIAWSPDGQLISAGEDQNIIAWDLETGRPRQILKGHIEAVNHVAWRPDGAYFSSGSGDNQIRVLSFKFLSPPCEWGVRNINPGTEWETYFAEQEYREICPNP